MICKLCHAEYFEGICPVCNYKTPKYNFPPVCDYCGEIRDHVSLDEKTLWQCVSCNEHLRAENRTDLIMTW